MRRTKLPIRKTTALLFWADVPLATIGALVLIQQAGFWGVGAWVCWVLLGVLVVNNKRIRNRFHKRSAQRAARRKTHQIDLGPHPWGGPGKQQPKPIVIDGKQMDAWFADEEAKLKAVETGEVEAEDGEKIEYNVYQYDTYRKEGQDQ